VGSANLVSMFKKKEATNIEEKEEQQNIEGVDSTLEEHGKKEEKVAIEETEIPVFDEAHWTFDEEPKEY